MKLKSSLVLTLPALTLLTASLQAAEVTALPAAQQTPATETTTPPEGARAITAAITPRLFLFDYFDGVGENQTHFLERYDTREGWSDDTRSGVFLDLDLDVTVRENERDLFVLERRGFGEHNHRGTAKYNDEKLGVYGSYSHYRSATGGIDYLFRPDAPELTNNGTTTGGIVPGPGGLQDGLGPYRNFSDDAGPYNYHIDRTTYRAGFKVKPAALGDQATIAVDYEGYSRNGDKFAPFFLNESNNVAGDGWGQQRWRGTRLDVDEKMNRVGLTVSGSPNKLFEVAYEVSFEEFTNKAPELQVERDILPAGVSLPVGATTNDRIASVLYMPDSQLVNHGIRASKTFNNRVVVAAGYGASWLKQESFSALELASGHTKGEIASDNAYLTAKALVSSGVSVEGHIKYSNRDNDSTYPDTLVSTTAAPRIDRINSLDYGASANWRPGFLGSNLTLGWRRLDIERDLTWVTIQPEQSLYREDTVSDEVYLKWTARPAMGWNLRVTPSFTWADKTGLVTEPEEMFKLKSMLSFAAPEGWVVSGFYDYTNKQNNNNSFTDGVGGLTYAQEADSTLQSVGLSLNASPHEYVNTYANLFWMQDDFSSYLIRSSVARWIPGVAFTRDDQPNYKVNSYVFNLGADWQYSDKLKLDGSYTFSKSTGDVASGAIQDSLVAATGTIDSIIDNTLHSFALGAEYLIDDKATLRVNYIYDRYEDDAYGLLSGGVHMMAVGVSYAM